MVMCVDEARRHHRAAEVVERKVTLFLQRTTCGLPLWRVTILAGGGWLTPHPGWGAAPGRFGRGRCGRALPDRWVAGADVCDQAVFDPQPAPLVLGTRVVHGHDPRVRENHTASSASGTSS